MNTKQEKERSIQQIKKIKKEARKERCKEKPDRVEKFIYFPMQFQKIPNDFLFSKKQAATRAIKLHLTALKTLPPKNRQISSICKMSCDLLAPTMKTSNKSPLPIDEDLHLELRDIPVRQSEYQFQRNWLTNIGYILPKSPHVMEILPYLLTCYTINRPLNKIDHFDSDITTDSWDEIFEPSSERILLRKQNDTYNRKKNIESLSKKFILPFHQKKSDLFEQAISKSNSEDFSISISVLRNQMQYWEAYRRFAAFCEACLTEKMVNLTLCMALFASIWDFPDISSHKKEYTDGNGHLLPQYTYQDVENNSLREVISRLMKKEHSIDLDEPNIYEMACHTRLDFQECLSTPARYPKGYDYYLRSLMYDR